MDHEIENFINKIENCAPIRNKIYKRSHYFLKDNKLLIIKISRSPKPFWGVRKSIIDFSNQTFPEYVLVLLSSYKKWYCFNKNEVITNISKEKWKYRVKDKEYKINMPLPQSNEYNSINDFLNKYFNTISNSIIPEEINDDRVFLEGTSKKIVINTFERNSQARHDCIQFYGLNCIVCGFNFEKKYGDIGKNYIHVHHIVPLSSINKSYKLNPINDLVPVCPNCHVMMHSKIPPLTVDELKKIIDIH